MTFAAIMLNARPGRVDLVGPSQANHTKRKVCCWKKQTNIIMTHLSIQKTQNCPNKSKSQFNSLLPTPHGPMQWISCSENRINLHRRHNSFGRSIDLIRRSSKRCPSNGSQKTERTWIPWWAHFSLSVPKSTLIWTWISKLFLPLPL